MKSIVSCTLAIALIICLTFFPTAQSNAEPVKFDFPQVKSDPNPLNILGPAGEIFTFVKTGATTDGRYVMAEAIIPTSDGPLPHVHHFTDEWFYFPEGGLTLEIGDNIYPDVKQVPGIDLPKDHFHLVKTTPGSLFYGPRYRIHGFLNDEQEPRKMVFIWTPDDAKTGITQYFKEVGQPIKNLSRPPAVKDRNKKLFVSQAPKYGINQSSYFLEYLDSVDYNFPEIDNKPEELLSLLCPDIDPGSENSSCR